MFANMTGKRLAAIANLSVAWEPPGFSGEVALFRLIGFRPLILRVICSQLHDSVNPPFMLIDWQIKVILERASPESERV
jgi:hypothetical protein